MKLSIKNRIYLSFTLLVSLFVVNAIITFITINSNKKLTNQITEVIDPSLQAIEDFDDMMVQSKMYTTNWVFLRTNQDDKNALIKLHSTDYPILKSRLKSYLLLWENKNWVDSVDNVMKGFEQLQLIEKGVMSSLNKFDDYDDPVKKFGGEQQLENIVLPKTAELMTALAKIIDFGEGLKTAENNSLNHSTAILRILIIFLAIIIIIIGVFLSVYMSRKIINPVNHIRFMVNDLGKGILQKINHRANGDEISEMIQSVNNLSEKLQLAGSFAKEIGNRNFNIPFKPLSEQDSLGKALITMRDNLKLSDERLNEAQNLAHMGNFEIDMVTNNTIWSDELYKMYGISKGDIQPSAETFLSFMHPDDADFAKKSVANAFTSLTDSSFNFRFLRKDGTERHGYTEWKFGFDVMRKPIRLYGITMDITERKEAEEVLRASNEELTKSNHELDKFVYSVSHDLRAPLLSMQGIVGITAEETKEEMTSVHMQMLNVSINRLDNFILEILEYSRNARLEVKNEMVDFKQLLNDITGNLQYMNGANNPVKIELDFNGQETFNTDKGRLSIVLSNLISNSIRYYNPKAEKPYVKIHVETDENESRIEVEDNGIGIKKENQQKIFDMFYRVSENSVGSGLGLYIVKETINKLHGEIIVESQPGTGTTFHMRIPNLMFQ